MAIGEHALRQGAGGPMQQKVMKVCQAFGSLVATAKKTGVEAQRTPCELWLVTVMALYQL